MNLKLEKGSIRVRVSFDEAVTLARDGRVQERLPMPGGDFVLGVSRAMTGPLNLETGSPRGIEMKVPNTELTAMLETVAKEHIDKSDLKLCAFVVTGEVTLNIVFEIDRFTVSRKSLALKKAAGP